MKKLCLTFTCLLFVTACQGTYKHTLVFNPTEPIRVAVLPFVQVNSKGEEIKPDASLLIDNVSLVSSKLSDTPAQYARKLVQNELSKSSLDVLAPALVDSRLSHSGFSKPDLSIDAWKAFQTNPKDICSKLLECDAVLYGKVTKWDRSYFGIQSVSAVGLDIKILSAKDSKVLFETRAEDSDSRGLTKGPTGFSDLVIEPLRGLDNQIITDLASSVVTKMISPLRVESRPEFLQSSPPAIFASSHDANFGVLKRNQHLTVLAYGSPHQTGTFSIGNVVEHLPMVELDAGHYVGEFYPLDSDKIIRQPVYVYLTDEFGRTTKQKLGNADISFIKS